MMSVEPKALMGFLGSKYRKKIDGRGTLFVLYWGLRARQHLTFISGPDRCVTSASLISPIQRSAHVGQNIA